MNLVVSNLKGGVGKTTTAVYLAAAAAARGYEPVVLVDADRQGSAAEWLEQSPVDGVNLVEAPSERMVARALSRDNSVTIVDSAPGDQRIAQAAFALADVVIIPTRAGGVEYSRVAATVDLIGDQTPYGLVICAARLGTNDLDGAITWWSQQHIALFGIVPERVGIAAGPEAHLYREGLDAYDSILQKAIRRARAERRPNRSK